MRLRSVIGAGAAIVLATTGLSACKSSGSGGGSGKTLTISSDLPLQGQNKDTSDSTNQLIALYLKQQKNKAGKYKIKFTTYDDSVAATGAWDPSTCTSNAHKHVSTTNEVAVMGTYNSGCAKLEVPILNGAPMLMISDANTNPGLTKTASGNDPGEPDKYYPSGKRNYGRVITTDDVQGQAGADYVANVLKLKRCYVVNDNSTYGKGVAGYFAEGAKKDGITVLGNDSWDSKATNYTALFTKIKNTNPDCLYIGGTYDQNGGQLVKDKFNILGDNTKVPMIGPDGFTGYPALDKQTQGQGMYLTFAGLSQDQLKASGGAAAKLIAAYQKQYGHPPVGSYPLYAVAAVQVILAAIAKSDGTRQSIVNQVFTGSGITISAKESILGKEVSLDPKTGDVSARDVSVLQIKNNAETFVQVQSVK